MVKLNVPIEAAATTPYTEDEVVRDFRGWEEAIAFAAVGTQNFIYERLGADALLPLRAGPVFRVIGGGGLAVQVSGAVRLQEQGGVPVSAGACVACGLRGFR